MVSMQGRNERGWLANSVLMGTEASFMQTQSLCQAMNLKQLRHSCSSCTFNGSTKATMEHLPCNLANKESSESARMIYLSRTMVEMYKVLSGERNRRDVRKLCFNKALLSIQPGATSATYDIGRTMPFYS